MAARGKEVDLDAIFKETGRLGKYQVLNLILVVLPVLFSAAPASEYLFTSRDLPYRCFVPECENNSSTAAFATEWQEFAIPAGDKCQRYAPLPTTGEDACSVRTFDRTKTVPCEEYVFGAKNSLIYDFNIPCQNWKRGMIGTIGSIAYFIILPLIGFLSDRFGRKVVLTVNAFNTGLSLAIRAYSTSYEMYIAVTFVGSLLGCGAFSTAYLMAAEMFGNEMRIFGGIATSTTYAIGHVLLALIAWAIPDWRTFSKVVAFPQLITITYFFILNESVRWLISKGHIERAKKILEKIATMNGKELSSESLESLNDAAHPPEEEAAVKHKSKEVQISVTRQVLSSKTLLRRACTTPVWWFSVVLVYYGLTINSVSLAGNVYINFMLISAIEIPGYVIAYFALNKLGRKTALGGAFTICAIANLAIPFLPDEMPWLQLVIFLIGKLFISAAITSVYIYTLELYPTQIRHSLMAFSSSIGRLGSISAPQTPLLAVYWSPLPNVIFGAFALLSVLLILTMPETLGTTLPDTIAEAENINKMKIPDS